MSIVARRIANAVVMVSGDGQRHQIVWNMFGFRFVAANTPRLHGTKARSLVSPHDALSRLNVVHALS
jgi:hypothetical protein